eukprot:9131304-Alexandrium_andersonii.AAC.1
MWRPLHFVLASPIINLVCSRGPAPISPKLPAEVSPKRARAPGHQNQRNVQAYSGWNGAAILPQGDNS